MGSDADLLTIYIDGWQLYNKYAFARPDLYYRLFWGQYHSMFSDALDTYYELFPLNGSVEYPAYFYTLLYTENVDERDFLMLRRAATRGIISDEDAKYFSRTNTLIVKGMLEIYMDKDTEERKKGEAECNSLLIKNLEKVLK